MKHQNKILIGFLFCMILTFSSCSGEADVKRDFNYEVKVEKYHKDVKVGETRELVFSIVREGEYENTDYGVSHFVREGSGTLTDERGEVLQENTVYRILPLKVHLFYTVSKSGTHKIEFLFKDSFGREKEMDIELSGKDPRIEE